MADEPELIQWSWNAPTIEPFSLTFTEHRKDAPVRLALEVDEDRNGLWIKTESYDSSEIEWGSCDWNLTVDQARILRNLLDRWLVKQVVTHSCSLEYICSYFERGCVTLNQRAHLLSAESGITPKDALDRLQGGER